MDVQRASLVERLLVLAAWEPVLTAPGFSIGTWQGGTADAHGVIQVPWIEYSPEVLHLLAEAGAWIHPFDWMAWVGTAEGRRLVIEPAAIADASPEDIGRVLTAIVRAERFGDGDVESAIERGTFLAISRRARALADQLGATDADATETQGGQNPAPRAAGSSGPPSSRPRGQPPARP